MVQSERVGKNWRIRSFLFTLPIWFLGMSSTRISPVGMVYGAMCSLKEETKREDQLKEIRNRGFQLFFRNCCLLDGPQ